MDSDDVAWCIKCADNLQSNICEQIKYLPGMVCVEKRHLLNNLCSLGYTNYLEVGVYAGASFASAMYRNKGHFFGIDNFSEFTGNESFKKRLIEEIISEYGNGQAIFFEEDAFLFNVSSLPNIDVFFYDGAHERETHKNVISHFGSILSNNAILVVDDFNVNAGHEGTEKGLRHSEFRFRAIAPSEVFGARPEWGHGICIYILERLKRLK